MNIKEFIAIGTILLLATLVRFVILDLVPAGLYVDEASIGYNAYSILQTGKDEYGKAFPVFFKSFATFQSSLYVYLTTIPISLFGPTIFSTRFISSLSGVLLILITYLFLKKLQIKYSLHLALLSALVIGLSPWAIFQSRVAVEANLALTILVLSLYLFQLSLKKSIFFIFACAILALSTYAYHGERFLSFIFLPFVLLIFKHYFKNHKKNVIIGILIFFLVQIPQLVLLTSPGSLRRFETQGFTQEKTFEKHGGSFKQIPLVGRYLYITRKFVAQYISSYSPRSLFFEPEDQSFRSMPNMSTFYFWMIIPLLIGIKEFWIKREDSVIKIIILSIVLGSSPAALTGDPFYTLRMLPMLWGMSIMISFGIFLLLQKLRFKIFQIGLSVLLITISCLMFYTSYFILFKHERSYAFGYPYLKLAQLTENMKNKTFLLDTEIYDVPYILMAFYKQFDPVAMQQQTDSSSLKEYYADTDFNKYRNVGNVSVRPLRWGKDPCVDQIIVGDVGTLSEPQAIEHHLTLFSEYKDLTGKTILWLYQTNPKDACKIII